MKKNFFLIIFVCLLLSINSFTYAQIKKENVQTNAEYVIELVRKSSTSAIYILASNYYKRYSSDWVSGISARNNLLVLKKKNIIYSWNLKDVVLIKKEGGEIKVYLSSAIYEKP